MSNNTRDGLTAQVTIDRLNKDGYIDLPCNSLKGAICPVSGQLVLWTNGDAHWEDSTDSDDFAALAAEYSSTIDAIKADCRAAK